MTSAKQVKTERKIYLDYIRIGSILAVILLHAVNHSIISTSPNQGQWIICNLFGSLTRWAVPVFVMISGSLMLEKNNITIKTLWSKNILHLSTAYLFWSFVYTMVFSTIPYYPLFSIAALYNTILGTLQMGYFHLWFLPMIIGLYIMLPILKAVVKDSSSELVHYIIGLGIILTFLWPSLSKVESIEKIFGAIITPLHDSYFPVFVFYFILGYYLDHTNFSENSRRIIYLFGIIGSVFTVASVILPALLHNTESKEFVLSESLNVMMMSSGVFVFLKSALSGRIVSEKKKNFIVKVSKLTFGVYLIHELIMNFVSDFILKYNIPVLSMIVIFVFTTIISFLLINVLSKVKCASKYIM